MFDVGEITLYPSRQSSPWALAVYVACAGGEGGMLWFLGRVFGWRAWVGLLFSREMQREILGERTVHGTGQGLLLSASVEGSKCYRYIGISAARGSALSWCRTNLHGESVNGAEVDWRGSFGKPVQAAFQVGYSWWYSHPYFLLALPNDGSLAWNFKARGWNPSRDSVKEEGTE